MTAGTSAETVAALDHVTVRYGTRPAAVEDVSLELRAGQCVVLTGASGCGKSTVLRLLNGLVPHVVGAEVTGGVRAAGVEPAAVPLHEVGRRVATVFQNPRTQFFCTDPAAEMAFGSENAGEDPDAIRARVGAVMDRLGLRALDGRDMAGLSAGERQRVALGAAVCDRPSLYLLDEPTANLDEDAVAALRTALGRLRADGATILVAEHRLHYLHGLADRVVRLAGGRVAEELPADEFFALADERRRELGLRSLRPPVRPRPPRDVPDAEDHGRGLTCQHPRFGPLSFPRGTVTALLGPNGVGKTWTARLLAGLHRARAEVRLDGRTLSRSARARRVALVMQDVNRQLFAPSVREELALGRRVPAADVDEALDRLDIAELADRHPLALSGGQQQRVAVASALVEGRDVCLFDEPSSGLDHRAMRAVSGVVRDLARAGAVVVLITHDAELVEECADRVVELTSPRGLDAEERAP